MSSPELGIYFIVETKAGKQDNNLQEVERNKIQCGKLHFQAVSEQIHFDWVNSYEDYLYLFAVADNSDFTQFVDVDQLNEDEKNIWDWVHNQQKNLHIGSVLRHIPQHKVQCRSLG